MNIVNLTPTALTSGAGATTSMAHELATRQSGVVQVDGINDETVQIQGRLEGSMGWVTLSTFTADGVADITLFPQMRANMSAGTGSITARIGA